jgi:hypothetical protein
MRSGSRINARRDKQLTPKGSLTRKRTSRSLSQDVKVSLTRCCDAESHKSGGFLSVLKAAGFVGCADGDEDLSSDYKEHLTRTLGRKE